MLQRQRVLQYTVEAAHGSLNCCNFNIHFAFDVGQKPTVLSHAFETFSRQFWCGSEEEHDKITFSALVTESLSPKCSERRSCVLGPTET